MIIEVTQEDIDKAEQKNSCECAIAVAVERATNRKVRVCYGGIMPEEDWSAPALYKTTKAMERFFTKFDEDRTKVKPTKFKLMKVSN